MAPGALERRRPDGGSARRVVRALAVQPEWIPSVASYPRDGDTLVVIGNFDGVHLGHQAVVRDAAKLARARGLVPVVLTFDPHPAEVLGKGQHQRLTDTRRKVELLLEVSPSLRVVVEPFTRQLAALSPEQFASELLVAGLGAKVVLVGDNFRFGKGRQGDLTVLERIGGGLGFEARATTLERADGEVVSSSRVRAALAQGASVEPLLGRSHCVIAEVVAGDQRGRSLGFPTANLGPCREMLPGAGVYACRVEIELPVGTAPLGVGVANVGVRPTVTGGDPDVRPSVEIHIVDFQGDLYGNRLRVHFVRKLRDERQFSDLNALREQIARDVESARGT